MGESRSNGPWKITSSIQRYKNPWIEVVEDQVVRPDGKPGIFGLVRMNPGASALAMDEEGFVYLTQEFRYAIGKDSIEVVSGGIEKGETSLSAAKRELREELGIEAKEWTDLGRVDPFTSVVDSPAFIFLARKLTFSDAHSEGTEDIKPLKLKIEDAVQMVIDSKITHAQSGVLILKAASYLGISH